MAKKASAMQSGGYQVGRLVDQSGGMVDSTVYPTLLNDNEAASLKNVSLDEKGTVKPCKGRSKRFATAFDASNACNGIGAFYPDTATSRLVMGAGTKLYKDTPHLINRWTDQADWQETNSHRCNADTTTTAGDVKVLAAPAATFARASVKYKSDGTQVASGVASYETGKFSNGIHSTEGTTNILSADQSNIETDTTGFVTADGGVLLNSGATISRDTIEHWTDLASLKVVTPGTNPYEGVATSGIAANANTAYTVSVYVKAPAGIALQLYARDYTNGINSPLTSITGNGLWQRVTATLTTGATAVTDLKMVVRNGSTALATTFYIDGLQIEQKAYATPWHIGGGTRSGDSLYYTMAKTLPSEWLLSGFWIPDLASTAGGSNKYLSNLYSDVNNRMLVYYNPTDDKLYFTKVYGSGTTVNLSSVALTFSAGDVIAWAFAQLSQAYGDLSAGMHLWYKIGSAAVVHVSNSDTNLPSTSGVIYVGCGESSGNECNGVIDAVKLIDLKAELANGATINNTWAEAFLTAASAPTSTPATLFLAQLDGATTATATSGFVWISANKDISGAISTTSGKVEYANTVPGASSMAFKTRTSTDGITWDAWTAVDGSGNIGSTHHNYIQLAIIGTVSGSDSPSVQSSTLSYDSTPAAVELATGFTAGGQFYFATLLSYLVSVNKLDAPRKWDGTAAVATLGGTPPHGQYVAPHKNYLFMAHTTANPSRLHFSDIINLESWPALNFIDISPNDGDWITGLLPFDDYLIITKQRSVWALVGDGTSDFAVKRIHSGIGCIAPRSLIRMGELFGFAHTEGYYLSDITKPTLITERLKDTWDGLNKRRLNQIAAEFFDHKLRIDVPNGASTVNNLRIMYDSIRKALLLEEMDNHASCYTRYTEAGQEVLLYGHSTEGQVSQADTGTTDGGAAIDFEWKTKHFNFGSSATEKKVRNTYIAAVPAASNVTLTVYFIVDNVEVGTPISVTVTGSANEDVKTYKLKPRDVGIRKVRTLGYRVVQSTTNGGVKIHELLQEHMIKKIKAS